MDELIQDICEGLQIELQAEAGFDLSLLVSKVKTAYKDVKRARRYPGNYTQEMIDADMENYYINIWNIALYDYSKIGAEFQESHSENSVARTWQDRNELFAGILPIARL